MVAGSDAWGTYSSCGVGGGGGDGLPLEPPGTRVKALDGEGGRGGGELHGHERTKILNVTKMGFHLSSNTIATG